MSTQEARRSVARARLRARRRSQARRTLTAVGVVAAGGAIGALLRHLAGLLWPTAPGTFPVTVFLVNLVGCAAIGVLLVLVSEVGTWHPLARPFLATGVLGGFTTFSTYAVDSHGLLTSGHAWLGLTYLVATPVAALVAVWTTAAGTRRLVTRRIR